VQDLVGQAALTVDEVGDEHHPGHALLAGERWLAVSENGLTLAPQSPVTVAAVRGTTLVVRPLAAVRPG
jgi:membrane-bound ClpP family serine protease